MLPRVVSAVLASLALLVACGSERSSEPERIGQVQQGLLTFSAPSQVFDSSATVPVTDQRGADPVLVLDSTGTVYLTSISPAVDPGMTKGGNLWRKTASGWTYLGSAFDLPLGFEPHMTLDSQGRLWMIDTNYPPESLPVFRYDNPAAIVSRKTDWSARGAMTGGEHPWITTHGTKLYVQLGEGIVEPVIRVGTQDPPVIGPSIPLMTNPTLIAEAHIPHPDSQIVGAAQGAMKINPATGRMCIPLAPINGPTTNYFPAHSIWTACSIDGLTWTNTLVYQALSTVFVSSFWPNASIDSAGNFYFVFAANMDTTGAAIAGMNIFFVSSSDGGNTWSVPKKVNTVTGTNLFPTSVAGCNGGLDIVWYGTSTTSAGGPSMLPSAAEWHVYFAQTKTALSATPTFSEIDVAGTVIHYGPVNNRIAGTAVDNRMFTMPGVTLDADKNAHVAWASTGTEPLVSRLLANPLTAYMGNPQLGKLYYTKQTGGDTLASCP